MTVMCNKFFPLSVQIDLATENDWIYSLVFCDEKISKVSFDVQNMIQFEISQDVLLFFND